jgi:hypothetical protein
MLNNSTIKYITLSIKCQARHCVTIQKYILIFCNFYLFIQIFLIRKVKLEHLISVGGNMRKLVVILVTLVFAGSLFAESAAMASSMATAGSTSSAAVKKVEKKIVKKTKKVIKKKEAAAASSTAAAK